MKTIRFVCLLLATGLVLSACQNEQKHAQDEIARQEKLVQEGGGPEQASALLQQYLAYAGAYPEDAAASPRYLYRAAALQYRLSNYDAARASLEKAILEYYDNENTENCVLLLGSIYEEKLKDRVAASVLYQSAAERFPSLGSETAIAAMKGSGLAPVAQRMDAIARAMYPDTSGRIDLRMANDFITGCSVYALISPQGKDVPELLYKAGETARTIQAFSKAIELYDWLIEKYPDFDKLPQAMFLKGFTLENDLQRLEEARAVYEDFLVRYPQDDFADDAKFLLENLGRPDEEIINAFGAQQMEQ